MVLLILLALLCSCAHATFYIHSETDAELLAAAQSLGQQAKIEYINQVIGETDEKRRRSLYLEGLEKCNNIGSDQTDRIIHRANAESRPRDAALLQKIGLKHFTAQFMTVPVQFMKEIAHMACSKHEQQLQCGSVFEGEDVTRRRIEDLRTIGNHKMMFDFECVDNSFVPNTYPCIGQDVAGWTAPCRQEMEEYWELRESVNPRIMNIYETALNTVKKLKTRVASQSALQEFVFNDAMRTIARLEGDKCSLFKKTRDCVLPVLRSRCGAMAAAAIDTSITLGYLRTERRERLQLDFENFKYLQDPRCEGL